ERSVPGVEADRRGLPRFRTPDHAGAAILQPRAQRQDRDRNEREDQDGENQVQDDHGSPLNTETVVNARGPELMRPHQKKGAAARAGSRAGAAWSPLFLTARTGSARTS